MFHVHLRRKCIIYSPFGWKVLKIPIITLNVKGLDAPIKRYRLTEWVQNQDPCICCLQVTHFRPRHTYRLKVKGGKKIFHGNRNKKINNKSKQTYAGLFCQGKNCSFLKKKFL